MRTPTQYIDECLKGIMKLPFGKYPLPKTNSDYEKKVDAVKDIIDLEVDTILGFSLSFNNDYTKLYKHDNRNYKPFNWK